MAKMESDDDSSSEVLVVTQEPSGSKKTKKEKSPEDTKEEGSERDDDGDDAGDDNEDEDDEELYQVEKIMNHDAKFPDGKVRYEVKWLGYELKKDRTWETEENLVGAIELLQAYWDSVGGKPEAASSKKRGRKSNDKRRSSEPSAKKQKSAEPVSQKKDNRRKGRSGLNDKVEMESLEETGQDGWEPPKAGPGTWEEGVVAVHTIEASDDGTKWAYLMWAEEGPNGKKRQTKAKLPTCYMACPQIMLKFFESHLVFTDKVEKKTNGN